MASVAGDSESEQVRGHLFSLSNSASWFSVLRSEKRYAKLSNTMPCYFASCNKVGEVSRRVRYSGGTK